MKIPFFVQEFTQEMEDAALAALRNEQFVNGESVSKFEDEFARYIGTKYAVSVSSGNGALHLSLLALGLPNNSKIITSTNSFIASANCIRMINSKPILCDISDENLCLDPNKLINKINKNTKAVIYVTLNGRSGFITQIQKICNIQRIYSD